MHSRAETETKEGHAGWGRRLRDLATTKWWSFSLAGIVTVGLLLRLRSLGTESLWLDEAYSLRFATGPWSEVFTRAPADNHPPLYSLLLKVWVQLIGSTSEYALRSLSVLFGVGSIAMCGLLGRSVGGRRAGLLAAAFMAVSQFGIYYSQETRSYSLLALAGALVLHSYWLAFERPVPRGRIYFAAAALIALYVHFNAVFLLIGVAVHRTLRILQRPEELRPTVAPFATVAIGYLPWAWVVAKQTQRFVAQGFWVPEPAMANLLQAFLNLLAAGKPTPVAFSNAQPTSPAQVVALMLLGVAGVAAVAAGRRWRRYRDDEAGHRAGGTLLLAIAAGSSLILPFWISQVTTPIFLQRALIAALPALVTLCALGADALGNRWAVLGAGALLVALSIQPVLADQDLIQKEGWKLAAADIRDGSPAGSPVHYYAPSSVLPLRYYLHDPDYPLLAAPTDSAGLTNLSTWASNMPEAWLVLSHGGQTEYQALHEAFIASMNLTSNRNYGDVTVLHYAKT